MKIASWNINSLKAHFDHVKDWLATQKPDVLMLQELKGLEFPYEEFTALGYQACAVTQKTYNGVAILSKHPVTIIHETLPGMEQDDQARYLEVEIEGLRLINIYLPNGNPVGSEKFSYKLAWMDCLYKRLAALRAETIEFAVGGDFNVIPEDKDCHNPQAWMNDALFRPESRRKFRALLNQGLYDAFRIYNKKGEEYTFWDYQAGAWQRNHGIRIDHFLLSPACADHLLSCTIDKEPRGRERPSDHTPIIIELQDQA